MVSSYLIGIGSYLPTRILSNGDLEKMVDTSDEWIVTRTGIQERRIAAPGEDSSDMGAQAALKALASARVHPEEIDLILTATVTPDFLATNTAAIIQHKLGMHEVPAFDIQAACTGFIYGLCTAKAFVESGMYKNVLFVATEKMSSFVDYKDRNTCILFGDGAAAAVISANPKGFQIGATPIGSEGEFHDLIYIPAGGSRQPPTHESIEQGLHTFKMEGRETFKHAVRRMNGAAKLCLEKEGLSQEEVSWLIPHQANIRIIDAVARQFNIPSEKVFYTVQKYGNTSASSIPIALDSLLNTHPIQIGEKILLVAFGAGLTWGASLLTKV